MSACEIAREYVPENHSSRKKNEKRWKAVAEISLLLRGCVSLWCDC